MADLDDDTTRGGILPPWPQVPTVRAENFPVALWVLPVTTRRHLRALYGYARYLDDLGDEPVPGHSVGDRLALFDAFEAELVGCYADRSVQHPVLQALVPTIRECQLPIDPLLRLIECNRLEQQSAGFDTFDRLVAYCTRSANPVGELVLHIFGQAQPFRVALSNRICTALQLIEHLQDIAEDHRRGRIYLPTTELDQFGVASTDLSAPIATKELRDLIAYQADRAEAWLAAGSPLVPSLRGWARLTVGGYLAGGRAALEALAVSGFDPLPRPPTASRRQLLRHWLALTVRGAK